MIFLTVGTHEQPFDRLIKAIDEFVEEGVIQQVVFMQIGYATYFPKNCEWKKFISPQEMTEFIEKQILSLLMEHQLHSYLSLPEKKYLSLFRDLKNLTNTSTITS